MPKPPTHPLPAITHSIPRQKLPSTPHHHPSKNRTAATITYGHRTPNRLKQPPAATNRSTIHPKSCQRHLHTSIENLPPPRNPTVPQQPLMKTATPQATTARSKDHQPARKTEPKNPQRPSQPPQPKPKTGTTTATPTAATMPLSINWNQPGKIRWGASTALLAVRQNRRHHV